MKDPVRFGKYLLLDRVDVGGMAEVFRARGPDGETCAVKRLLPGLGEDPEISPCSSTRHGSPGSSSTRGWSPSTTSGGWGE